MSTVSLGTISVPQGSSYADASYPLPVGTQGLEITLDINGIPVTHVTVTGATTGTVYDPHDTGVPTEVGSSQLFVVPVDASQDSSVIVGVQTAGNVVHAGDAVAHISAMTDQPVTAVMGFRGGPPVVSSIPPSATYAAAQSNGTTTTLVAGVLGKKLRVWSMWVTGRATSPTTAMVAEIQDSNGKFMLVAEGFGAASETQFVGGLELDAGTGLQIVGSGVNSLLGGVVYDYAN